MGQINLAGTPVSNAAPVSKPDKKPRAKPKPKQGAMYIASGGYRWEEPKVYTPELLRDISESYYGASLISKLCNLIMPGAPDIKAIGPNGNEDESLSKDLMVMSESPDVRLYQKMRDAFQDTCWSGFGCFNDVWDYDGPKYRLMALRRLPPESFYTSIVVSPYTDPTFAGISIVDDKHQFYHTDLYKTELMVDPFYLFAPNSRAIAGTPLIKPIIPVIQFAQQGLFAMQQTVSRMGAPWGMIKLTDDYSEEDMEYADKILANWGKDSMFKLLPKMEWISPNLPEPKTPEAVVNLLAKMMLDFFSPASFIQNDGATLSTSDSGALQLFNAWITSMQAYYEDAFERLLQQYPDGNLYKDYHVEITLPRPPEDKTAQMLSLLKGWNDAGIADEMEMRALFPEHLKEWTPEELSAFLEKKKARQPVTQVISQPDQSGEMVSNATNDRMIQMLEESLKAS